MAWRRSIKFRTRTNGGLARTRFHEGPTFIYDGSGKNCQFLKQNCIAWNPVSAPPPSTTWTGGTNNCNTVIWDQKCLVSQTETSLTALNYDIQLFTSFLVTPKSIFNSKIVGLLMPVAVLLAYYPLIKENTCIDAHFLPTAPWPWCRLSL